MAGGARLAGAEGRGQAGGQLGGSGCPGSAWLKLQCPEDRTCPSPKLRPRGKRPGFRSWLSWLLVYLYLSVVMPGTRGREQSSEAGDSDPLGVLTQWMEWEATLGQMEGAGGQSA